MPNSPEPRFDRADVSLLRFRPHFLPGLFAHVAAVSPAVTWLEEFPLLEPIFEGWPEPVNGALTPGDEPGHGLVIEKSRRAQCELYRSTE